MRFSKRKILDLLSAYWMYAGIALVVILFGFIGVVLFIKASPVFYEQSVSDILFSDDWKPLSGKFGMLAFIISSLYITLIAVAISAPVCLLAAIFLTQYADRRLLTLMQPVIDILAGLPSVIYGVWGIIVIVPFVSDVIAPAFGRETNGYTILSAGLVLAVMIIPFMLNIMIEVLRSVPTDLKEASLSLGATYWQTIKYVVVKKSFPGIASAIGLGVSRAFGETIAVLMVAGNVTRVPENVFQPGYPLPALIANNYGEMMSIPLYDSALMLAALVLFVVVIFFNLIARSSIIRLEKYS